MPALEAEQRPRRLLAPEQDLLALGETVAHLSWLRQRGVLDCQLEADGIIRYNVVQSAIDEDMHW